MSHSDGVLCLSRIGLFFVGEHACGQRERESAREATDGVLTVLRFMSWVGG